MLLIHVFCPQASNTVSCVCMWCFSPSLCFVSASSFERHVRLYSPRPQLGYAATSQAFTAFILGSPRAELVQIFFSPYVVQLKTKEWHVHQRIYGLPVPIFTPRGRDLYIAFYICTRRLSLTCLSTETTAKEGGKFNHCTYEL